MVDDSLERRQCFLPSWFDARHLPAQGRSAEPGQQQENAAQSDTVPESARCRSSAQEPATETIVGHRRAPRASSHYIRPRGTSSHGRDSRVPGYAHFSMTVPAAPLGRTVQSWSTFPPGPCDCRWAPTPRNSLRRFAWRSRCCDTERLDSRCISRATLRSSRTWLAPTLLLPRTKR